MIFYGQYAETLVKLGLSHNESKVYLSSLKSGVATAKIIAKNAEIAREEVYRILPSLQELGLVKKHVTSPAQYEATPPFEVMKILLKSRDQENEQLKSQVHEFLNLCKEEIEPIDNEDVKTIVVSRDNSTGLDIELMRLVKKTKKTFDFTTRQKLFLEAFDEPGLTEWINEMYYAVERGVKFRMIMDGPKNFKPLSEIAFSIPNSNLLLKHSNFDFRYVLTPPECIMILFDCQASCIETACKKETKFSPYMVTNNPVFAALNRTYFEFLWNQGLTEGQWKRANEKSIKMGRRKNTKNLSLSTIA